MDYEAADRLPNAVPELGFYYHYKHDPVGPIDQYAYEVLGVGHHTEDDCRPEDANMVVYRPLYEAFVYRHGKLFDLRPLEMFMSTVEKDGETKPRFGKVTDPERIAALSEIRDRMYPS